jgi:hypothetical protein
VGHTGRRAPRTTPRAAAPSSASENSDTSCPLLSQPLEPPAYRVRTPHEGGLAVSSSGFPGTAPSRRFSSESVGTIRRPPFSSGRSAGVARRQGAPASAGDDLIYLNGGPVCGRWTPRSPARGDAIEARVRRAIRIQDDFITIPFPRLAAASDGQIATAVENYRRQVTIVDARLQRAVACAFKATALSDLCEKLRADTGIRLAAASSVADEKVTLFCAEMPLRQVMRQLSRPFGYTWLRSGKPGEYRYELVQDLKSQLLEEEFRNRDRNAALIALHEQIERYRPYLHLSPDEALARMRTAPAGEKELLERLAEKGWGPIQMYFRLTTQEMAALRAGQVLTFGAEPGPGELPLPADVARGVLQSYRDWRAGGESDSRQYLPAEALPEGVPLTTDPHIRPVVRLALKEIELGRYTLDHSGAGFTTPDSGSFMMSGMSLAAGERPPADRSGDDTLDTRLARDPVLRRRVTVAPDDLHYASGGSWAGAGPRQTPASSPPRRTRRLTTADVLEALHRATGWPIVADYYMRLFAREAVTAIDQSGYAALNQLCRTMLLRWDRDGEWLQFRSRRYYHDRLKEVPNRLLERWAAARRRQGAPLPDDLAEVAGLSDAQLDATDMAEGARELYGLEEWDLVRDPSLRPHLRYFASLPPAQRQAALSPAGLPFNRMPLAQQQQFILLAPRPGSPAPRSLQQLAAASLRVEYDPSGWFVWRGTGEMAPADHLVPREPAVRAPTLAAALEAARRLDPHVTASEIVPAEPGLRFTYELGMDQPRHVYRWNMNRGNWSYTLTAKRD